MSVENNAKNIHRLADALKSEREKTEQLDVRCSELEKGLGVLADKLNTLSQNMIMLGVANNFDSGPTATDT